MLPTHGKRLYDSRTTMTLSMTRLNCEWRIMDGTFGSIKVQVKLTDNSLTLMLEKKSWIING